MKIICLLLFIHCTLKSYFKFGYGMFITGYVKIQTNLGTINLELHCDKAPKACENFLLLCKRGYYNGTKFHRSIKHFMVSKIIFINVCGDDSLIHTLIEQIVFVDSRWRPDGYWYWRRKRMGGTFCG